MTHGLCYQLSSQDLPLTFRDEDIYFTADSYCDAITSYFYLSRDKNELSLLLLHLCLSSFLRVVCSDLFIIMRIVHMNPNSSDGLLTWGLPNSRWILNQLERKIPVKDVITRYRILIKSKIFYVFLVLKIILIFS